MADLYPVPQPYDEGILPVAGHSLHYYQFGAPHGVPLLFNHGGPGEGVQPEELRFFDPAYFRIIAIDQRGCGKSVPHLADDAAAALHGNDPAQLVADLEALRLQLRVDRWHLRGNSWGSTLSLLYAIAHPQRVCSLLLSGIYLNRACDRYWYEERLELIYPQQAATIRGWLTPEWHASELRIDRIADHLERGAVDDGLAIAQAAWDMAATRFQPQMPEQPDEQERRQQIALGSLAAFYIARRPLPENWFRTNEAITALAHIPIVIRNGQYDIATPSGLAQALAHAHPHADFRMVPNGGHVTGEPAMAAALLEAAEGLKAQAL